MSLPNNRTALRPLGMRLPLWPLSRQHPNPVTPERTLELADQCVKCGLCLPHCPTYRISLDEAESPRGRIALVQGWLGGTLPPSGALFGHLDRCLGCRACERACPSGVAYGAILDAARTQQRRDAHPLGRWRDRLALGILGSPRWVALLGFGAMAARGIGAPRLASWLGLERWRALGPSLRLLPFLDRPRVRPRAFSDGAHPEGTLNLFLGCVSRISHPQTLAAATRVLEYLGRTVHIPVGQGCCGALWRHNGFPDQADTLLRANHRPLGGHPTLVIASACAAELQGTASHGLQAEEICGFLERQPWPSTALRPLPRRVWVHEPCSHRYPLGGTAAVYALLRRIPELRIEALPENAFCCGAAGSFLLRQPAIAERLLQDKLRWLKQDPPELLVTTNTGCALHLAAGIRAAGLPIEVCHPVDLLARQLAQPAGGCSLKRDHPTPKIP